MEYMNGDRIKAYHCFLFHRRHNDYYNQQLSFTQSCGVLHFLAGLHG